MLLRSLLILGLILAPAVAQPRGRGADGNFSERKSSHFRLLQDVDIDRYSGPRGSRQFERDVLAVLESAYRQVADGVGIRPRTDFAVVIYDPNVFDQNFSSRFGFRAAGFFDGVIHVRGASQVDQRLVRTLHHEYTHAALGWQAGGVAPAWLNEGLAEYFEAMSVGKRYLSPGENQYLANAARTGQWIPLQSLSTPNFAHLGGGSASLAYLESYATIEYLVRKHGMRKMRSMCENLVKTRSAPRALDRTYRKSLSEIEEELLTEIL